MALNSHGLNLMGDYPMKLSHLLTGAALVALTAGAAHAQKVTVADADGTAALEDFQAANVFASEIDLSVTKPAGELEFLFDASTAGAGGTGLFNALGAADKATITITLTGDLVFDAQVADTDFHNVSGSTCDFNVQSGGAAGSKSVVFVSNGNTATCDVNNNDIGFSPDIEVRGAGNFTLTVAGPSGQLFTETYDGLPADLDSRADLVRLLPGVTVAINQDGVVTQALAANTSGVAFDNMSADLALGTIAFTETGRLVDFGVLGTAADSETFALDTAAGATTFDILTAASFTVTLPSTSGFTGINFAGSGSGANSTVNFASGSNTVTATLAATNLTEADLDNGDTITITLVDRADNDGTPVSFQKPTVSASFTGGTNVNLSGLAKSGELQTITLEGVSQSDPTGAPFRWVGDGGGTDSIFRCYVDDASVRVFASLTNATNNIDGTYDLGTIAAPNGELIVTSDMISAVSGAFSRADVTFSVAAPGNFVVATTGANNAGNNSCDRMLLSGAGTLSDFSADYN
ncbi:hypothetical protein [Marinicauda sp. Alg238-R41]|uniref:hypothetical protein n=1 Tax=Marinicauda sp. Alg238-R41 TaxID=2993447 RepID=UPI0022E34292|nr:hypothetical protein [Marinicauda sp. Alg238-R41]